MKTAVLSLTIILLAVSIRTALAVNGADKALHGVIPGGPSNGGSNNARVSARDVIEERHDQCQMDSVLRALGERKECDRAQPFCSSYLRRTVTTTVSKKVSTTSLQTQYTTVLITSTKAFTSVVAGPTVTCAAAPVPNQTCNYPAYGYGQYLISQMIGIPAIACHERCLVDPKCLSFQVEDPGGSDYCNTFSNRTMGNVLYILGGGYTFFDRNCPDYLPSQCSSGGAVRKRHLPTPPYLATIDCSRISSACNCLIKTPSPPITKTALATSTQTFRDTTTLRVTSTTVASNKVYRTSTVIVTAARGMSN